MNLRYWDGLDWTDARRSPPSEAELLSYEQLQALETAHQYQQPGSAALAATAAAEAARANRPNTGQIVEEVRRAARTEVERAADLFSERTRSMQREVLPLVTEYSNRIVKWVRFAAIVAVLLLIAWFLFQVIAQASLFEWIGDRIDNLTDEQNGAPVIGAWLSPPY